LTIRVHSIEIYKSCILINKQLSNGVKNIINKILDEINLDINLVNITDRKHNYAILGKELAYDKSKIKNSNIIKHRNKTMVITKKDLLSLTFVETDIFNLSCTIWVEISINELLDSNYKQVCNLIKVIFLDTVEKFYIDYVKK